MAHLELTSGSNKWNVIFAREAYDWKVDVFVSFFKVQYLVKVIQEGVDKFY